VAPAALPAFRRLPDQPAHSIRLTAHTPRGKNLHPCMKFSIVIPVYNERRTLRELLRRVAGVELDKELVLIDDCSTDGSRDILESVAKHGLSHILEPEEIAGQTEVKVVFHERNQGKGAALRRGFQEASGEIIGIQDADLEYDPNEFPKLIKPIADGKADVVFGSRYAGSERRVLYFWHTMGNKGLTLLSNLFTNLSLTDMETCYKVFRADVIKGLTLEEDRFGFEPEVTAKVAKRHLRIFEIPISYQGRGYAEGKKIGFKDLFRTVYAIFKYAAK